jgi:hypothetical protein
MHTVFQFSSMLPQLALSMNVFTTVRAAVLESNTARWQHGPGHLVFGRILRTGWEQGQKVGLKDARNPSPVVEFSIIK